MWGWGEGMQEDSRQSQPCYHNLQEVIGNFSAKEWTDQFHILEGLRFHWEEWIGEAPYWQIRRPISNFWSNSEMVRD